MSPDTLHDMFPYAYSPETGLPWYLRYSAEGASYGRAVAHAPAYGLKSRYKKFSAPPEELEHFRDQRELIRRLPELDAAANAAPHTGNGRATLAAVGDLMWIRKGWNSFLSGDVLSYLNGFDAVIGNLESVISPRFKVPAFRRDYLRYNSDPALVDSFTRPAGASTFTALAIGNNHSLDCGGAGLVDTMRFLDSRHILHSGARESPDTKPYATFERNGIKFGFYAACWGLNATRRKAPAGPAVNILNGLAPETDGPADITGVKQALDAMGAEGVDFRIVGIHWGREYEFYPTPRTMQVARDIVRAGADLIVGSHPHVQQPSEVCFVNGYEDRYGSAVEKCAAMRTQGGCILNDGRSRPRKALVMYSLGNFVTAMSTRYCRIGIIQDIEVFRAQGSGIADWRLRRFPNYELVYNYRDPDTRAHRLEMMSGYLRDGCRGERRSARLLEAVTFLNAHLGAHSPDV